LAKSLCEIIQRILDLLTRRMQAAIGITEIDLALAIRTKYPGFEASIEERNFDRIAALGALGIDVRLIQIDHLLSSVSASSGESHARATLLE
jgi:hypothetical protein